MKPADIVMIFGNPKDSTNPIGLARLHRFISKEGDFEYWSVEYLDDEEHFYNALIKTQK